MSKEYNVEYFREQLPEWKRKRDPIMVRFLYRPISFYTSVFCADRGIQANSVSIFSAVIGLTGCILLAIPSNMTGIISGLLMNVWIILDCTDGNLARNVKKQAYGEFLDAMSSYLLIGFLFLSMGFRSYFINGLLSISGECYILLGALNSVCGILMSLLYQKFILVSRELGINEKLSYDGSNSSSIMKWKTMIDMNLSVGGVLPVLILFGALFQFIEVIVVLWAAYYILEFSATTFYFIYKAVVYYKVHDSCDEK